VLFNLTHSANLRCVAFANLGEGQSALPDAQCHPALSQQVDRKRAQHQP
jgi:hypothetical protein